MIVQIRPQQTQDTGRHISTVQPSCFCMLIIYRFQVCKLEAHPNICWITHPGINTVYPYSRAFPITFWCTQMSFKTSLVGQKCKSFDYLSKGKLGRRETPRENIILQQYLADIEILFGPSKKIGHDSVEDFLYYPFTIELLKLGMNNYL